MKNNCSGIYYKELLSEPDSHIGGKVKIVLDLSNYATKKIRACYSY